MNKLKEKQYRQAFPIKLRKWSGGDVVALRKKIGLSQEEFAFRLDISVSQIKKWEVELTKVPGIAGTLFSILAERIEVNERHDS